MHPQSRYQKLPPKLRWQNLTMIGFRFPYGPLNRILRKVQASLPMPMPCFPNAHALSTIKTNTRNQKHYSHHSPIVLGAPPPTRSQHTDSDQEALHKLGLKSREGKSPQLTAILEVKVTRLAPSLALKCSFPQIRGTPERVPTMVMGYSVLFFWGLGLPKSFYYSLPAFPEAYTHQPKS